MMRLGRVTGIKGLQTIRVALSNFKCIVIYYWCYYHLFYDLCNKDGVFIFIKREQT